jgi:ribonuclease Z
VYTNNSGVTPPNSFAEIPHFSGEDSSSVERKRFFKQLLKNGDLSEDGRDQLIDYLRNQDIASKETSTQAPSQTGSSGWRPDKPLATAVYHGTVDFFNDTGGYGFISCAKVSEDVFYHMEELGGRDIQEDTDVAFVYEDTEKGPRATNVRLVIDGEEESVSTANSEEAIYTGDKFDSRPPLTVFREAKLYDAAMNVTFLGTAGDQPTKNRTTSSLLIERGAERFLFDVGEGTQQRLLAHSSSVSIDAIFLTSVATDHIGGLGPLLKRYSADDRTKQLRIFAPSETADEIEALIDAFGEFEYPIVVREVTSEEIVDTETYRIEAFETDSSEPTVGYALREVPRRGTFDRERAEALGVPEGPAFEELCAGQSVVLEDEREIDPRQVVGDPTAGRHIVYTGDTRPTAEIVAASENADLLIHEAAAVDEFADLSHSTGHSTAIDAGRSASRADAQKLILTNFAPGFGSRTHELQQEARNEYDEVVEIANDGVQIELPVPSPNDSPNRQEITISDEEIGFSDLEEGVYIQVTVDRVKQSGVGLSKTGQVHIDDADDYVDEDVVVMISSKESGYVKAAIKRPPSDTVVYPLRLRSAKSRRAKSTSGKKKSRRKKQRKSKGSKSKRKSRRKSRPTNGRNPFRDRSGKNRSLVRKKL